MRDLELFIPDPGKATLRDLARTFDAELVLERTARVDNWIEHTILLRDRWARERFAIGNLGYPAHETGPLAYIATHEGLERARARLVEGLHWFTLDDIRHALRHACPPFPREILAEMRSYFGI